MTAPAPIKPPHLLMMGAFDFSVWTHLAMRDHGCNYWQMDIFARLLSPDDFRTGCNYEGNLRPSEIDVAIAEITATIRHYLPRELQGAWAAPESDGADET